MSMTNSKSIFVVGQPDDEPPSQYRPTSKPAARNHETASLLRAPHAVTKTTQFSEGDWSERYELARGPATNTAPLRTPTPSTSNPTTTNTTMTHQPQTQQARDVEILRELITTTVGNATFAMNTFNLPAAAQALRQAANFADRLVLVNAGTLVGNAGLSGEFAGYDMNAEIGDEPAAKTKVATNTGKPGSEFDGYDMNESV